MTAMTPMTFSNDPNDPNTPSYRPSTCFRAARLAWFSVA